MEGIYLRLRTSRTQLMTSPRACPSAHTSGHWQSSQAADGAGVWACSWVGGSADRCALRAWRPLSATWGGPEKSVQGDLPVGRARAAIRFVWEEVGPAVRGQMGPRAAAWSGARPKKAGVEAHG